MKLVYFNYESFFTPDHANFSVDARLCPADRKHPRSPEF